MGEKEKVSVDIIPASAEVIGAAAGVALGYLTDNAAYGAAGGALISHTLKLGLSEMRQRLLGKREGIRIDATIEFAARKARENILQGQRIREDFFQEQPGDRSTAEETLEGVLLAAQREHQEKKLRFYGNLWANIAFAPLISRDQANLLLRIGKDLSYRQLCFLRLLEVKEQYGLRQQGYRESRNVDHEVAALLQEIYQLYLLGIVNAGRSMLGLSDVTPGIMRLQGTGRVLYPLMELEQIPSEDLEHVASLLG